MKKTTKILSFIMALAMMIASFSAFGIEAFAASKPNKTSVTSVAYSKGKTVAKVKKVSYKETSSSTKEVIDYYELQYSEDSSFKTGVNATLSPCSDTPTFIIDVPFSTDTTIYFRARTKRITSTKKFSGWSVDSTTYSDWSSKYKADITWVVDDNPDDGAYNAHLQAQAVIAQVGITDSMSDLEKVARVQNWINNNWYYSQDDYPLTGGYGFYESLFKFGYGACNDFAWAFIEFMKELNIPCKIVGREASHGAETDHFWNIIKINGYWWNYDCEAYGYGNGGNISNFRVEENKSSYLSEESLTLWNSCQPHGEDTGTAYDYDGKYHKNTAVIEMNNQFNQLVASLG